MRHRESHKMVNAPIKSPSPDIAHRSIIQNTQPPISDVQNYIRRHSKSPISDRSSVREFRMVDKSQEKLNNLVQQLSS